MSSRRKENDNAVSISTRRYSEYIGRSYDYLILLSCRSYGVLGGDGNRKCVWCVGQLHAESSVHVPSRSRWLDLLDSLPDCRAAKLYTCLSHQLMGSILFLSTSAGNGSHLDWNDSVYRTQFLGTV